MKIDLLFQIAAIGIITAVLNQLLTKSERSEQALLVTVAGLIIVLVLVIGEVKSLFDMMRATFSL